MARLKVAWSYETHDEFTGSEMQSNPIVVDGVMYFTSPKLRVIALDAASGKELWSYGPTGGRGSTGRYRHRGVVVYPECGRAVGEREHAGGDLRRAADHGEHGEREPPLLARAHSRA